MRIAILGGDGFIGWPTTLHFSQQGHDVTIVDNLSRRWIDTELGVQSLTAMDSIQERQRVWREVSGRSLGFEHIDVAEQYERFKDWLGAWRPEAIVHFAEQRAAREPGQEWDVLRRHDIRSDPDGNHRARPWMRPRERGCPASGSAR